MIECYPYKVTAKDTPYWIPVILFKRCFDQHDFICNRVAKTVVDAYSNNWFYTNPDGRLMYELATVQIVSGKTQFISGRHRTSVLIKHIDPLPIALYKNALTFAGELNLEPIDLSKSIYLPSLQMRDY